ncbi:MAG: STAS domain-containing protein [Nitrospirota bacterium]
MDFKVEASGKVGILTIDGGIIIHHAYELREALMKSLHTFEQMVINFENLTDIDLTCLQLLCSAHRTSLKLNKNLTLAGKNLERFKKIAKDAGFYRHMGCVLDNNKSCLWISGDA